MFFHCIRPKSEIFPQFVGYAFGYLLQGILISQVCECGLDFTLPVSHQRRYISFVIPKGFEMVEVNWYALRPQCFPHNNIASVWGSFCLELISLTLSSYAAIESLLSFGYLEFITDNLLFLVTTPLAGIGACHP